MLQRGDSGTIYIVLIMALIIVASFVMVGGLGFEFKEPKTQATLENGLPPISDDKDCAKAIKDQYGRGPDSKFSETDKAQKAPEEC